MGRTTNLPFLSLPLYVLFALTSEHSSEANAALGTATYPTLVPERYLTSGVRNCLKRVQTCCYRHVKCGNRCYTEMCSQKTRCILYKLGHCFQWKPINFCEERCYNRLCPRFECTPLRLRRPKSFERPYMHNRFHSIGDRLVSIKRPYLPHRNTLGSGRYPNKRKRQHLFQNSFDQHNLSPTKTRPRKLHQRWRDPLLSPSSNSASNYAPKKRQMRRRPFKEHKKSRSLPRHGYLHSLPPVPWDRLRETQDAEYRKQPRIVSRKPKHESHRSENVNRAAAKKAKAIRKPLLKSPWGLNAPLPSGAFLVLRMDGSLVSHRAN